MPTKPSIESVAGFSISSVVAGLKPSGARDLGLVVAPDGAAAAGVFTKSRVVSPAVTISRRHLKTSGGHAHAILVNAGNANCCTGKEGQRNARASAQQVAQHLAVKPSEILIASTGVIGQQLDMPKLSAGIDAALSAQRKKPRAGQFSEAIMTTDLVPKCAGGQLAGNAGSIAGVAKGSGMIAPNMATMLGFVLTDCAISASVLQVALRNACDETFNCVTVDSDCSTNDTVFVLASGKAAGRRITRASGKAYTAFAAGLRAVCMSLAEQIARDGEGATKLVRVQVTGAKSATDARRVARSIAESPLVKTAMFGNDPNWGRILMAVGKSGAAVREEKIRVQLCGVDMLCAGTPQPFAEAALSKKLRAKEVTLAVDLGLGRGACQFLTCDFSYDYVRINAEYTT